MAGVAVPEQAVDVRFPELLGVKALDILIDVLVLGGVGIGHVGQVAGQVGLRPVGAEVVEVTSGLIFPFLVCGGGNDPCEKHTVHVFLGLHVHHEHLAFRDVEGVLVRLINLHLFELLVGHVLQGDGDVVFEKSVAVEAHFLDAAPHVGECPVGVAQSGQAAHQLEQHRAFGHVVGIDVEHGGVFVLVHFLQFADDLCLFQCDGAASQHDAVQPDVVCRAKMVFALFRDDGAVQRVHAHIGDDDSHGRVFPFPFVPDAGVEDTVFPSGGCGVQCGRVFRAVNPHVGAGERERFLVELVSGKYFSGDAATEWVFQPDPGFGLKTVSEVDLRMDVGCQGQDEDEECGEAFCAAPWRWHGCAVCGCCRVPPGGDVPVSGCMFHCMGSWICVDGSLFS